MLEQGSVALIKTGQALSLRPDILRNHIWAEELGKLSDAVGSFSDRTALSILCTELADIIPRIEEQQAKVGLPKRQKRTIVKQKNGIILNLFEFYNDKRAVASASIGQVYKATVSCKHPFRTCKVQMLLCLLSNPLLSHHFLTQDTTGAIARGGYWESGSGLLGRKSCRH